MNGLGALTPYLVLILVGFLPNEIWRLLGIVVARGIDEDSELIIWVRAVAVAILAAVIAKMIVVSPGALANVPLTVRLGRHRLRLPGVPADASIGFCRTCRRRGGADRGRAAVRSVMARCSELLHPELVHADESRRIFGFEHVPAVKIGGGLVFRKASAIVLQRLAGEADKAKAVLAQESRDLRDRELMLLHVEQQVAAFAGGEEV